MQDSTLALSLQQAQADVITPPTRASGPWLDPNEERRLIAAFQRGNLRAGDTLVRANLPLVRAVARSYRLWGSAVDDLMQQGSIGLLKAARKFDPTRAQNLRTYAGYWIRAEIREYVVRSYRIVRLGSTRTERKALRAYRVREVATAAELAKESGMPLARCEQLWPLITRRDTHIDDADGIGLDRVAQNSEDPELLAMRCERTTRMNVEVHAALSILSQRERRIVEARMMSDEPSTLDALGLELGLSRERVRQIESAIKTKMRERLDADLAA
jgi:RNA polymerase sigma-32 factor